MIDRLSPRRSLAAAIGWSVGAVVLAASLLSAEFAAGEAQRAAQADARQMARQLAVEARNELRMAVAARSSVIQATAAQIAGPGEHSPGTLRHHLEAVHKAFPELLWLGIADENGRIAVASDGRLVGERVGDAPWYTAARAGPFAGEGADLGLPRGLDIAAPLTDAAGRPAGVLAARLAWTWIEQLQARPPASPDTTRRFELVIVAQDGRVALGPPTLRGRTIRGASELEEGGRFIVGAAVDPPADAAGLPWDVYLRQPATAALAPAARVHETVLLTVLLAGAAMAAAAVAATQLLTRRLGALAAQAQAVRQGGRKTIDAPAGADEVSQIGAAMSELVAHLQHEKAELAALNAELDARVQQRTARIERMAEEARHAAVTRERLRMARDLHDTLAHSLMALLTQIRLVRKMKDRLSAESVEAELATAEDVAARGLADARAAINQMRDGGVRESGLAQALRQLLKRFGERSGVDATLQADGPAADLADDRAQTVYRIVEEALRNIERHAKARHASVKLASLGGDGPASAADARLSVEVVDDGVGFDPDAPHPGHFGLVGIREQAALIGAQFELDSAPGQGTRLRIELPA